MLEGRFLAEQALATRIVGEQKVALSGRGKARMKNSNDFGISMHVTQLVIFDSYRVTHVSSANIMRSKQTKRFGIVVAVLQRACHSYLYSFQTLHIRSLHVALEV